MPHPIDLKEIADRNPKVDLDRLAEGRKLLELLRRAGVRGAGYRAATSRAQRRARVLDDLASDPRVVRLQRQEK
jgi:hypothetical protein